MDHHVQEAHTRGRLSVQVTGEDGNRLNQANQSRIIWDRLVEDFATKTMDE
jgi:hypothetical protein